MKQTGEQAKNTQKHAQADSRDMPEYLLQSFSNCELMSQTAGQSQIKQLAHRTRRIKKRRAQ